jgi:hypothetical protein
MHEKRKMHDKCIKIRALNEERTQNGRCTKNASKTQDARKMNRKTQEKRTKNARCPKNARNNEKRIVARVHDDDGARASARAHSSACVHAQKKEETRTHKKGKKSSSWRAYIIMACMWMMARMHHVIACH